MSEDFIFPEDQMNRIEDGVYLGDLDGAQNLHLLRENKIKRVLSLLEDFEYQTFAEFQYKQIQIIDNTSSNLLQYIPECIQFISEAQKRKENILVHCVAGISRSPSVLIAYFMVKYSDSYDAARNYVYRGRPGIYPNEGFIAQLRSINVNEYKRYLCPN